jgi:hypothetical protein
VLLSKIGDMEGKIESASVWTILDIGGQRTQDQNQRVGKAMRDLGWRRGNTAGTIKCGGKNVMGYVRGEEPHWNTIVAERYFDKDAGTHELRVYVTRGGGDEVQGSLQLEPGGPAAKVGQTNMGHCDPALDPPDPLQ